MPVILAILGFCWAAVGVFNLIGMYLTGGRDLAGLASLGWAINGSLFILPGLAAGLVGRHLMREKNANKTRIDAVRAGRL